MNKYTVTFNYNREITELQTEAQTNYQAILKCLAVMARKYGVSRNSMIRYFSSEQQNIDCKEKTNVK